MSYTAEEILNAIKEKSDFTFELSVIKTLNKLGYSSTHSGTYTDPVSKKIRQFDIRSEKHISRLKLADVTIDVFVRLAVECKCFRNERPIIIHRTKRLFEESLHDVIYFPDENAQRSLAIAGKFNPDGWILRFEGRSTELFSQGDFVGRSINQVSSPKPGVLDLSDGEVFEKMTQAISSVDDIVKDISKMKRFINSQIFGAFPILVVPDGRLWKVDYSGDGEIADNPKQTDFVDFYIGRESSPSFENIHKKFNISHMYISTLSGLETLIRSSFEKNFKFGYPTFLSRDMVLAEALRSSK